LRQFGIGTHAVQSFFLLKFPLLFQDDTRLVKRRRALLESNSPRNNQLETHRNDEPGGGSWVAPRYWFLLHRRRYGYRRISAELRRRGMLVNHKRVLRIMGKDNLLAVQPRAFVVTTDSDHEFVFIEALIQNERWLRSWPSPAVC
jgi:hypothetical protein